MNAASPSDYPAALFAGLPECFHEQVRHYWQDWSVACQQAGVDPESVLPLEQLACVWACSDFAAKVMLRRPDVLHTLFEEGLQSDRDIDFYRQLVAGSLVELKEDRVIMHSLRLIRQQEILRIALRDLLDQAPVEQILRELSLLAEAFIVETLGHLERLAWIAIGEPLDEDGNVQSLLVLAMGKLGGYELNFSSDIDLIFCYPEEGYTKGLRKLSNHEFFVRLAQRLVKALNEVTADGFVYRVDTRLRPYGNSGPLVVSFASMEQYYQTQGREWERYAMIKARLLTGGEHEVSYLEDLLRPFIYRRYLDYSAFESIREMKAMIESEVRRKGMDNNIKLGRGGIREIEFIGQTFQLIRGGRDVALRTRRLLTVLELLRAHKILEAEVVEKLSQAYRFYRRLENRLQMVRDQQTHSLGDDETSIQRMVLAMRFDDTATFLGQIKTHREYVHESFQNIMSQQAEEPGKALSAFWINTEETETLCTWLSEQGYANPPDIIHLLQVFGRSAKIKRLPESAASRLQRLLHNMLIEISGYSEQKHLLDTVLELLLAVIGRSVYINLLIENRSVREHLLNYCSRSSWLASQIIQHPLLLDELLVSNALCEVSTCEQLSAELNDMLAVVDDDDLEEQMDRMRHFVFTQRFRIATMDISRVIRVVDVSNALSRTAEVILAAVLQKAWQQVSKKHGEPACLKNGEILRPEMGIVAYGKLGGEELGYDSDLDIVFLHNGTAEQAYTDGEKPVDNTLFFTRVAQRALHMLATRTYAGVLYEVDIRLRPEGKSGTMVSSTRAFDDYQQNKAWTWEHQALLRARLVTGSDNLRQEFDRIRCSVLAKERDALKLCTDVVEMRSKMREHLASREPGHFDIKQDVGGLVDIEFIAQLGVLLNAAKNQAMLNTTSTITFLQSLAETGWLNSDECSDLVETYRFYRQKLNDEALEYTDTEADDLQIQSLRERVQVIWQRVTTCS